MTIKEWKQAKSRYWRTPFSWFQWYYWCLRTELWEYDDLLTSNGDALATDDGATFQSASIPELS